MVGIEKADRSDSAVGVQVKDGEFTFLFGVAGQQVLLVAEENAVRVFFHLRQGEHAADAGHAVDVGEKHGVMFIEPFRTFALEETIGVFTGAHGEADDDVAHVGPGRNVGIALVLIFDREGSELVSDDVGIGGGGTSSAIQECE